MTDLSATAKSSCEFDDFHALLSSWPPPPPHSLHPRLGQATIQPQRGQAAQATFEAAVERLTVESMRLASEIDAARRRLAELEQELESVRVEERLSALEVLRTLIVAFGIRSDELTAPVQGALEASRLDAAPDAAEPPAETAMGRGLYLGPNGEVWLGRGRRPTWLKQALLRGEQLADYWKAGLDLGSPPSTPGADLPGVVTPRTSKEIEEPELVW